MKMALNDQDVYQYGGETGEQTKSPAAVFPPGGTYKFSEEELRTLQECNTESFFQRSMPLGTLFGLGTFSAVQRGTLKPNPRFGPYPKVTLAVIVGYFLGKLSYQRACADKLMALPNSYIGQLLREKRDSRGLATKQMAPAPPMLGARPDEIYSDAGPGNSLDLDVDRPLFSEDSYRPTESDGDLYVDNIQQNIVPSRYESGGSPAPADPLTRPARSYDELRRQNRGDYSNARRDPYRVEPIPSPAVTRARSPPDSRPSTNKYGDVME